jgi:hypothetical protein
MGWAFWRKKKVVYRPRLVFELWPGGRIGVTCDWPDLNTTEEKASQGGSLAAMIFFLNDGQLLSLCQQAVAVCGHLKGDERLSQHVLSTLQQLLSQNRSHRQDGKDDNDEEPLIPADEVFSRRHEE